MNMLYTIPDYYKEFTCIADKCEDTCCAGWQIVIDDGTLKQYKKIKGSFAERMRRSVDWKEGTFRQDKEKRCAFLNDENLCDLYLSQGEQGFCKTCRQYPRHIEEFEGVREVTLSISCPEVARILMERMTPVTFQSFEKQGQEEEYEDFDPFLFSILEDARTSMIEILQNRELPMEERTLLILGMAHDMQGRINRNNMFDCFDVVAKYKTEQAKTFVREQKAYIKTDRQEMFEKLYELELLKEDWYVLLRETEHLLYEQDSDDCRRAFAAWKQENPEIDIHLEQLLVYFIFTYLPGAVYDGYVFAKVQMAVYCVNMIEELWMGRWLLNERTLECDEITELVYRFSREVEHSDENLKHLERMMRRKYYINVTKNETKARERKR